ncbi:hypothetical protein [Haloarcula salinisoli]|uniref:Uncharacterized protein n=1 Tax=Haloarcula salinisoli TaxID=2487746 RepID=A0A8J7YBY8_9EURY|nr:hypothetical protein [Halomicroarcula salinisoli]MBX0285764.1 hypothetical protein [Halomicroarcula salinisoli]MBX0302747.1 hypothetical protein [Halomicroarcula salinisoli]
MNCPRCGGTLTRYRLGERETVGCQECEYVGVTVDHTAEHGPPESWDDAIDRFEEQGQSVAKIRREDLPVDVPAAAESTGEQLINGMGDELVEDGDLVFPVFDEAVSDDETAARENGESADATH